MKKLVLVFTAVVMLVFALAGCELFGETSKPQESAPVSNPGTVSDGNSSAEPSADTSEPDTSKPDVSTPDVSEPDVSTPDVSEPDVSEPSGDADAAYAKLTSQPGYECGTIYSKASVIYTKVNPITVLGTGVSHTEKIAAIYDGTMTRFFSMDGPYITSLGGDYTRAVGSYFTSEKDYQNNILFTLTKEGTYEFERNAELAVGISDTFTFYNTFDGKVYCFDGNELLKAADGYVYLCRAVDYGSSAALAYEKNGEAAIPSSDASNVGKSGAVKDGKVIIPFEYDEMSCGDCVISGTKDGKVYYFNMNGEIIGNADGYTAGTAPVGTHAWVFNGTQGYVIEFRK